MRKIISCVSLVAVALVAACSDSTTQPGSALTTDQVQSMTTALSFLLGVSLGQPQASLGAPSHLNARRVVADQLPLGGSVACPEGGHVGVTGTFSNDTAGNGTFALTDTLLACAIKDNHSNTWTFTSKPTLAVTLEELTNIHGDSIDLDHVTLIQTDVGVVSYSTGAMSGNCPLNVSIRYGAAFHTPTADSATFSLSTAGTVCGMSVTRDTSYTVPFSPAHFSRRSGM
jgi:hypothetical protein